MKTFFIVFLTFTVVVSGSTSTSDDDSNADAGNDGDDFCDADGGLCRPKQNDLDAEFPEKRQKHPNCRKFRVTDFNPDSPTIFYMESRGRLGNQVEL